MAINFVIPFNIILEIAMLAVQAYAYHYNKDLLYARIDQIYLVVGAVALLGSFIWLGYLNRKTTRYTSTVRSLRYIEAAVLIITGSLMVYSAQDIQSEPLCSVMETYFGECQKYVAKLAAGILAAVNGFAYFIRPCKMPATPLLHFTTNINAEQYPHPPSYAAPQPNEPPPVYGFQSQYYPSQPLPGSVPYPQNHYMPPPPYQNVTNENNYGVGYNGHPHVASHQQPEPHGQPPAYTNSAFE